MVSVITNSIARLGLLACNVTDDIRFLLKQAKNVDWDDDREIEHFAVSVTFAISNNPGLQKIVATYLAAVIAFEKVLNEGVDYSTTLSRLRAAFINWLSTPDFCLDIRRAYEERKPEFLALAEEAKAKHEALKEATPVDPNWGFKRLTDEQQLTLLMEFARKACVLLSAPEFEYADAT